MNGVLQYLKNHSTLISNKAAIVQIWISYPNDNDNDDDDDDINCH